MEFFDTYYIPPFLGVSAVSGVIKNGASELRESGASLEDEALDLDSPTASELIFGRF